MALKRKFDGTLGLRPEPHSGANGKVRDSPKSAGFLFFSLWVDVWMKVVDRSREIRRTDHQTTAAKP